MWVGMSTYLVKPNFVGNINRFEVRYDNDLS